MARKQTPAFLLKEATKKRDAGDLKGAEASLRLAAEYFLKASKRQDYEADPSAQAAAYELALLCSLSGRHSEADSLLEQLGFVCKLSPSILDGSAASTKNSSSQGVKDLVRAFDDVLPTSLLKRLQDAFGPKSPFWREHSYPTPNFFSYNQTVVGNSANTGRHTAPLVETVTKHIIPFAEKSFPGIFGGSKGKQVGSVEWWSHLRPSGVSSGHQMHYDLDEAKLALLKPGSEPPAPLVSCVLYLSGPEDEECEMAATLITDQDLSKGSQAKRAWLCRPRLNRLLLFNGRMLHGVVPSLPQQVLPSKKGHEEPRVTLMLGLWDKNAGPTLSTGLPSGVLGPNMPLPGKKLKLRWPNLFDDAKGRSSSSSSVLRRPAASARKDPAQKAEKESVEAALCGPIRPVWVSINKSKSSSNRKKRPRDDSEASVEFFGRWFLKHKASELQDRVIAEACRGANDDNESEICEEVSLEELERLRALSSKKQRR